MTTLRVEPELITIARKDFSDRHLAGRVPVLVIDGLADWPVMHRWSPEDRQWIRRTSGASVFRSRRSRI
jgi:hypothetical protein